MSVSNHSSADDMPAEARIEAEARAAADAIRADVKAQRLRESPHQLLERVQSIRDPIVRHRAAELVLADDRT